MLKNIATALYSLGLLLLCTSSLSASDATNREADYLTFAKNALLQVQELDKSPEIGEAIAAIDRARMSASSSVSSQGEDGFSAVVLAAVLISFLAACVAVIFFVSRKDSSASSKKGLRGPSKGNETKSGEIIRQLKYLSTDMSVSDELILEMRNEARRLLKKR